VALIGASSGHGPVRFGVEERFSTEKDNRNWYKSQISANSSASGQKFRQKF